jgi:hypothetical protein
MGEGFLMAYRNDTGYPSVTQILKPFINTDWFTQEHADRGTIVHDYCHQYLAGEWFMPALPPEYQGYFDSFRRWADQAIDDVILAETRLIDPVYGFCGQPDFIGRIYGDPAPVLLDWKTSQAYQRWFALQGAAYRLLAKTDKKIETTRAGSVRLKADGSGALVDWETPGALNVFLGILNAHHYFKKG